MLNRSASNPRLILAACALVALGAAGLAATVRADPGSPATGAKPVDFDRDIKAILSDNCFKCHGFDANTRAAGLRLDTSEGAFQKLKSGKAAVVPGKPEQSELVRRIEAENGLKMPPAATGKKLSPAQVDVLKRWIAQGAKYEAHWAFVPAKRPALPPVRNRKWVANPIDQFILARLEREGLKPSPTADRYTLIRRVAFDLTGLPPTPAEVGTFLGDAEPGAYERMVDRYLASPHYGERMALKWLDLSRYADTHGYHIDSHRDMWPWRDWVIRAFNQNLPYDQFTIWQLAGDLLPNPTREQIVATGFNRNHPINYEGGAIPEEYHTAYVTDRVDTTATTWMALTAKCASCHDHKYDPITQKEFYNLYAYFNTIDEQGLDGQRGNARPFIKVPTPEQEKQLAAYASRITELEGKLKTRAAAVAAEQAAWEKVASANLDAAAGLTDGLVAHYGFDERAGEQVQDRSGRQSSAAIRGKADWQGGKAGGALKLDGKTFVETGAEQQFDKGDRFSYGGWVYPTSRAALTVISRMDSSAGSRGWDLYLQDLKPYVHLIHEWDKNAIRVNAKAALPINQWSHVFATYDGSGKAEGVKLYVNGKPADLDITHNTLTGTLVSKAPLVLGQRTPGAPFQGMLDEIRVYDRDLPAEAVQHLAEIDPVREILATEAGKRTDAQKEALAKYYLAWMDAPSREMTAELADTRKKHADVDASIATTMVMKEQEKPRETFFLIRGQYDKKGDKVTPTTPAFLPPLPKHAAPNRLALAQWLVSPEHPLTARVAVNRFWQMYFGSGIVKSSENFGLQADKPTHPELLDWLATEFIRTGWDIKGFQRLILTSNTYKQSSQASAELVQRDPENLLLARGPRFRLPAEFIRDQALAVSGLLVPKIGGPSVKPYQPKGLWEEISFGGGFTAQTYEQDHGEKLYRRSLYTFWKRTSPPPSLQTFDAPEREFCVVRRSVSNTPLQALVLMNDPTYVEASRKFGERLMTEVTALPKDRIRYAYRLALGRPAKDEELRVLLNVYNEQLEHFRQDKAAAEKLLSVGESKRNEKLDAAELAAWTSVASVVFNLDEMITKN